MPPKVIRTVRDIIYYQYAKIISNSAGFGKENYGMIISYWKKLKNQEITWSSTVREWVHEHESPNHCIYCGIEDKLTTEHILPRIRGGEDCIDNVVRVCRRCNSSKGDKRLYEWRGYKNRDEQARIAEGKYLKYLYGLHEKRGSLDIESMADLCPHCDMARDA